MPLLSPRRDIDGLRAVAVLAVMLFHLEVPGFAGGFVGVDVFFVISGYLITRILLRGARQGGRIRDFYVRRILRIVPALAVVALSCALAGAWLLLPSEVTRLGASLSAAALFAANFHFLGYHGYDNALAQQVPLLHLWSLSVEEQFYLLYPALLAVAAWRLRSRHFLVLALLAAGSFLLALGVALRSPQAAFLLGPTRAWELLLGGALAVLPPRLAPKGAGARQAWALGGATLIALAIAAWNALPWPQTVFLLLPCVGAALVVVSGEQGPTWVARVLSLRPLVFVGLISYSLYLWHWPLIVFFRSVRPFEPGIELFVLPVATLLAALTWRWVEQPMRRAAWTPNTVFAAGAAVSVAMLLAGASLVATQGAAGRLSERVRYLDGFNQSRDPQAAREGRCFLPPRQVMPANLDRALCLAGEAGKPSWLLVGDSHAAHLWSGLAGAWPEVRWLQATASGCRPVLEAGGSDECARFMAHVLREVVETHKPEAVWLSARWMGTDPAAVRRTADELARRGIRVVVVGPAPEYVDALPRLLALAEWRGNSQLPDRARRRDLLEVDARLAQALRGSGAAYLSLQAILCPGGGRCDTQSPGGVPLQFDYGHFTAPGARLAADRLRQALAARGVSGV